MENENSEGAQVPDMKIRADEAAKKEILDEVDKTSLTIKREIFKLGYKHGWIACGAERSEINTALREIIKELSEAARYAVARLVYDGAEDSDQCERFEKIITRAKERIK